MANETLKRRNDGEVRHRGQGGHRQKAARLSPLRRCASSSARQCSRRGCRGDETGTTPRVAIAMRHLRECDDGDHLPTSHPPCEGAVHRTPTGPATGLGRSTGSANTQRLRHVVCFSALASRRSILHGHETAPAVLCGIGTTSWPWPRHSTYCAGTIAPERRAASRRGAHPLV